MSRPILLWTYIATRALCSYLQDTRARYKGERAEILVLSRELWWLAGSFRFLGFARNDSGGPAPASGPGGSQ